MCPTQKTNQIPKVSRPEEYHEAAQEVPTMAQQKLSSMLQVTTPTMISVSLALPIAKYSKLTSQYCRAMYMEV